MSSVERRPKVGIVLGSGGIKSFSAIALFEFLDEMGIVVDLLVGCSGGGLAAAARGAEFTPAQMRNLIGEFLDREAFSRVDYRTLLGLAHLPFGRFDKEAGILKSDYVRQAFRDVFKDLRLEDLRPTTLLQATDILTGQGVVLSRGPVADALCATTALFPLLPPVCIEGRWLVDGAYSSSVPVMEAVNHHMDVIIVFVTTTQIATEPGSFFEYFSNLISRTQTAHERREMALAIDLHHHEIVIVNVHFDQVIQMWDVDQVPIILEAGQKAVEHKKGEILSAIESFSVKQNGRASVNSTPGQ
jgi:NTE family protein